VNVSTLVHRGPTMLRSALRDLRYGRPLGGTVRSRHEHLGAFHATNSPYEDLDRVFAGVEPAPGETIVDVGCGKGRSLNYLLGRFPRNPIVGIELDPELCRKTARRLQRRSNVTIVCGDASRLIPPEGRFFYLFNPFDGDVTARFAQALLDRGRPATIVYYNAKFLDAFADPRFTVRELDDQALAHRSAIVKLA